MRSLLVVLFFALMSACSADEVLGPATLVGDVRSLSTFLPLEGVTAQVGKRSATTGADGHFVLTGLPTGGVDVVYSSDGFEDETVHLVLGADTNTTSVYMEPKGSGQYVDSIKLVPTVTPLVMTGPGSIRIRAYVYHGVYTYPQPGQTDTATIAISTTGPATAKWELGSLGWRAAVVTVTAPGTVTVTASYQGKTASTSITAVDPRFKSLSLASGYGCGLDLDDTAWCWGGNFNGALGYPTLGKCNGSACQYGGNDGNPSPLPVAGGAKFSQIATTGYSCYLGFAFGICGRTCALTAAGEAWCWGEGIAAVPTRVASTLTLKSLALHPAVYPATIESCGLTTDGKAYCFTATATTALAPDMTFQALAVGSSHSCGIDVSGDAYCWGSNQQANLGIGSADTDAHPTPVKVQTTAKFTAIAVGRASTCGLQTTGELLCWGYYGSLASPPVCDAANASCIMQPQAAANGATYSSMVHADLNAEVCAMTSTGSVDCWTNPTSPPVQPFSEPMASIGVASSTSSAPTFATWCGVAATGIIYCGSPTQATARFP
jgi:hypothetical protein